MVGGRGVLYRANERARSRRRMQRPTSAANEAEGGLPFWATSVLGGRAAVRTNTILQLHYNDIVILLEEKVT
jgi:hypothetical protein